MPSNARVWVYQSDKELTSEEEGLINVRVRDFLDRWVAHGQDLKCSAGIFHKQFLVLSVDENFNQTSGCSIDSSVHFVQELERDLNLSFFDRSKIVFLDDGRIFVETLQGIKNQIASGHIKENMITFNNMVTKKQEFDDQWKIPAKDSWLARYF